MERFEAGSPEHWVLLAVFAVGVVVAAWLGRRWRGSPRGVTFTRWYAVAIPVFTVPLQVLQLLPDDFDLGTSLPLQLCDLSWMVAVHALWTRSRRTTAVLYFWALTLTVQGIVTPSLDQAFPDPRFFMFWGMHLLTVWAAVHLVCAVGGPRWADYRLTVAVTAAWAVAMMAFNAVTGTNYGYLNRKPDSASLLDVMGPWPVYVVVEVLVLAVGWAAMTWPWTRSADRRTG
jgi:hypothetical integral membrane protein (TIGR02206 family)